MNTPIHRRDFLHASAVAVGSALLPATAAAESVTPADKAVKALYDSLAEPQRKIMCHDWDKPGYGKYPLRLHVTNNWAVSPMAIASLTKEQQALVGDIFQSVLQPDWPEKLHQQAKDDTGVDWMRDRKIAIFGTPGSGKCQCVISGFHLTFRAGTDPSSPVAFGGAISHGHQPSGFFEKPGHPDNIFWYQALEAHKLYEFLNGKQQQTALVAKGMPYYDFGNGIDRTPILPESKFTNPMEPDVRFRGANAAELPGLPIADMSRDQKEALQKVMQRLLEPYRPAYQERVMKCLEKQGGLDRCHLIFYQERSRGKEGAWENWRIEGPAFVWYFRGYPHVHIWIHVSEDPQVPVTSHFG
ncbi:hypothetical protein AYO44_13240 [Planctomycetaceae bacterium SCGC AG-212-F19]|nr:hypothetical protein AYO44_13240 [Planctomycetaceae bacterium SCGC AG-212-F19]